MPRRSEELTVAAVGGNLNVKYFMKKKIIKEISKTSHFGG